MYAVTYIVPNFEMTVPPGRRLSPCVYRLQGVGALLGDGKTSLNRLQVLTGISWPWI
jgi:hypothetical protein